MSFVINPFAFAAAGGGGIVPVTRQVYSNEGLSGITNTNPASPTSLVSLTFTPDANKTYAIFWSGEMQNSVAGEDVSLILYEAGVESLRGTESPKEVGSPVDYKQRGGFIIHAAGASPSSTTWELKLARTGASGTAAAKNGRLVALRLETGDHYGESLGSDTQSGGSSSTYLDKATVTFDAGAGQDYLIIASAVQNPTNNNIAARSRITDGTNFSYVCQGFRSASTGALYALGILWHRPGLTGSQTFKHQFSASGDAQSVSCANARVLALALGAVYDSHITTLGSDNSGTDSSYTDALAMTETPAAADHLTFASWHYKGNSTSFSSQIQLRDGGSSVCENVSETPSSAAGMGHASFVCRAVTYAAASRTWDIQRLSEGGTMTTTIDAGACIASLQLEP